MNNLSNSTTVRDCLEQALREELIGPGPLREEWTEKHTDEILGPQDKPRQRYSAGVLFPRKALVQDDDDDRDEMEVATPSDAPDADELQESTDELVEEGRARRRFQNESDGRTPSDADDRSEHNPNEQEVNRANEYLPSAMGLTCLVEVPKRLRVKVSAALYHKVEQEGLGELHSKTLKPQPHFFRRLIEAVVEINGDTLLREERIVLSHDVDAGLRIKLGEENTELVVHVFSRCIKGRTSATQRLITVTLMNTRTCEEGERPGDDDCYFQCGFRLIDVDGAACILEYPERRLSSDSNASADEVEEEHLLALLYREHRVFAIGHGCAAEWVTPENGRTKEVFTEVLPRHEIFPLNFDAGGLVLPMGTLANASDREILRSCLSLADAYEVWINERANEVPAEHREAGERQILKCKNCLSRMREGIKVLSTNADAMQVFRWMNEAMQKQGIHYGRASEAKHKRAMVFPDMPRPVARGGRGGRHAPLMAQEVFPERAFEPPTEIELKARRWRPFQLAFILMNLQGLVDPTGQGRADREIVDLIWFPTGGGKTEAYLGLTAMTIFWRRLRNPKDDATIVLMRYTLRLLTTQQFQRAASLICACDLIRQREARLKGEAISIGLWVGGSVTPNKHSDAVRAWKRLCDEGKPNPFVLLNCPWCGCGLGPIPCGTVFRVPGYIRDGSDENPTIVFRCPDKECEFHSSLPVHVVDQAIYQARPTLLIGTVDKFAMMPWNPEAMRLFGLSIKLGRQHAPPSLIIQDELHLIAGALGSMVGHYEMTIDALTHDGDVPAKIIAATATICRAADQAEKLYNRKVEIFPPQGLLASDSFFAQEDRSKPGRVYLGVMGTALGSHVTAQVRTLAALLQMPATLGRDGFVAEAIDPYWTLMIYFNSLRELGHAATLMHADIQERLFYLWSRMGIKRPTVSEQLDPRRFLNRDEELTSRVSGDEVSATLAKLFEKCSDALNEKGIRQHKALDACLATNMIQVGLDVPRLGLMAVIGQPKGTSEYIQATSRVGRASAGLVVTIYNASKPRDRSHYEHFRSYHQSLYRWVEPTSVTPFALPVRDRALHAQMITLARYWGSIDSFAQRNLVANPSIPPRGALLDAIRDMIMTRCRKIDVDELAGVQGRFDDVLKRWQTFTPMTYGGFILNDDSRLMYPMGPPPRDAWRDYALKTPTSMRGVDSTCDSSVHGQFLSNPQTSI
ncbi:helicase-related protein [Prosthecobacter sp.]|uniref:helicase-related protein n=1 Tax=Prosthecobacter sp. TaxID=1965333 RepID=UPI003783A766